MFRLMCPINGWVIVPQCNGEGGLFAPNASASLEFDKESVGVNEIFCTDCPELKRLGVYKSESYEFT